MAITDLTSALLADPALACVAPALEVGWITPRLAEMLGQAVTLQAIRPLRHKVGRRCLIAYDLVTRNGEPLTLLGKARSRGPDYASYQLQQQFWQQGFDDHSDDGISVPQPLGILPEVNLWVQRWVPGTVATAKLAGQGGLDGCDRIAQALTKLHRASLPVRKSHTMADELAILHQRLPSVVADYPHWQERIARVLERCTDIAATLPAVTPTGIHRDFYPDQVLMGDARLYLIDLDLYCQGDPALDVGNFVAHLTEQSLREQGDPDGLLKPETALIERCCALNPALTAAAIDGYKTLTLVRHIAISHSMPSRRRFTPRLLELCEARLSAT